MGLVSVKEVAKVLHLNQYGPLGLLIAGLVMLATRITAINRRYNRSKNLSGPAFLDATLKHYNITFEIPQEDVKRLPKSGPYITISNHPLGGVDGMVLLQLLLQQRSDAKVMGNFLLHRIAPLQPHLIPVNPFKQHKNAKSNIAGFKNALMHLQQGHPLGIFPAGEVATRKQGEQIVDKPWETAALKLIQKAQVPVVPIYFHARNSRLFYLLSKISPVLRTAKLPSELSTQSQRRIQVRIGQPIALSTQKQQKTLTAFAALLRKKTYLLANTFERKPLIHKLPTPRKIPKKPKKIAAAVTPQALEAEIKTLREKDCRLLQSNNYEVYLAQQKDMPLLLNEIGRQREITFRAVGEGTNKAIDLDVFDTYYHHLFLWDIAQKTLVGAYRMGLGAHIFKQHGIQGFYLQTLFRFAPALYGMMQHSIEMGRAYIIKQYQQKPMPLFLLWKGIVHTTLKYPQHTYLIGGVSISNHFSRFSKSLMIEFVKSNYWDAHVAQHVRPKKEFRAKLKAADKAFVFDGTQADLKKFDKLIGELEPGSLRMPILLKKYINQNAKVAAFNVDPLFNNSVVALMYITIANLPQSTVKPIMEEFQAELERKMAGGNNTNEA